MAVHRAFDMTTALVIILLASAYTYYIVSLSSAAVVSYFYQGPARAVLETALQSINVTYVDNNDMLLSEYRGFLSTIYSMLGSDASSSRIVSFKYKDRLLQPVYTSYVARLNIRYFNGVDDLVEGYPGVPVNATIYMRPPKNVAVLGHCVKVDLGLHRTMDGQQIVIVVVDGFLGGK